MNSQLSGLLLAIGLIIVAGILVTTGKPGGAPGFTGCLRSGGLRE